MESNYWTVINLLLSCVRNGKVEADELKEARLSLSKDLDGRIVGNLPTDEDERLLSVLDGLYGLIPTGHE